MTTGSNKLSIHINVLISASALQAIVSHTKQMAEKEVKGVFRVDTAEQVSTMVTCFLEKRDFDSYVRDINNYPQFSG